MTTRSPLIAFLATALLIPGTNAAEPGLPAGPRMAGRVSSAFLKLDRDGDGRLSFGEWYRSRRGAEAMPSKALGFFRVSDLNRNRRLSSYEFGRSQGIRVPRPNSNLKPGVLGGTTQGATLSTGSSGGSNTTSGIAGGSSLTRGGGTTGGTLVIRGTGGGSSGAVINSVSGTVAFNGSANTLTLGSGGTTIIMPTPQTLPTGSGSTNFFGSTLFGSGSLTLTGGGTIPGGTLMIRDSFTRYIGLTLEAAQQLAETERRPSRVISIDGERQTVTMDWSPVRVNFSLVGGIVTAAIGG